MDQKVDPRALAEATIMRPEDVEARYAKESEATEGEAAPEPFDGKIRDNVLKRECGECQLCCELLRIAEIEKEDWKRCEHQCESGCGIYADRPPVCKDFVCAWLVDESDILRDEHRPDKIGVVYTVQEMNGGIGVVAHTLKFANILKTKVEKINRKIVKRFGPVTVVAGDEDEIHTVRQ